jgi:hypothetical protein
MNPMTAHEAMNNATTEDDMVAKRRKERIGCSPDYVRPYNRNTGTLVLYSSGLWGAGFFGACTATPAKRCFARTPAAHPHALASPRSRGNATDSERSLSNDITIRISESGQSSEICLYLPFQPANPANCANLANCRINNLCVFNGRQGRALIRSGWSESVASHPLAKRGEKDGAPWYFSWFVGSDRGTRESCVGGDPLGRVDRFIHGKGVGG